jgi:hypothetical protein
MAWRSAGRKGPTNDMHPKDSVRLLLGNEFDNAFGIQIRFGTGIGDEWELSNVVLDSRSFDILLSLADPSDLRMGVDNGGNSLVVDMAVS